MRTFHDDIFLQRKIDLIHSANVVHTLHQQQKQGKYCDIKVVVGDKQYFAHRCILAASSTQLDSQIHGLDTIQLVGVTYYGFECLLEILYSGKLSEISCVDNRKFQQIISAADALNAESVMEYCTRERADLMSYLLQQSTSPVDANQTVVVDEVSIKEEIKENDLSFDKPGDDLQSNLMKLEYYRNQLCGEEIEDGGSGSEEEANTSNNKINAESLAGDSKCEICDLEFKSIDDLRDHLDAVHQPNPFICETCGMSFKLKSNLTNHCQVHNNQCVCRICGMKFKLLKHLQTHMDTKHEQSFQKNKLWKSNLKSKKVKRFPSVNKLAGNSKVNGINVEEIMRTNGKYLCPLCSRGFERRWNLKCHLLVHKSKKNGKLTSSEAFTPSSRRKDRCYVPGGFPCPECNKPFRNLHNLRRHAAALHGMSSKEVAEAISNGNEEVGESEEETTVVKKRASPVAPNSNYWCSICNRGFIRSRNLKSHMDLHKTTGEGSFSCGICGRKFLQKESLHGHLWVHGGKGEGETSL